MRRWIDDEKDRCSERVRKAREKVDAAKQKVVTFYLKEFNQCFRVRCFLIEVVFFRKTN